MSDSALKPVNITDAKGVQAGDNNIQFNFFGGQPSDADIEKVRNAAMTHGSDSPKLIQLLSRLIDRHDQTRMFSRSASDVPCRCFVVECHLGDAPEYLAYKLNLSAHMKRNGLRQINVEEIAPVNIAFEPTGPTQFLAALEDELEDQLGNWLQKVNRLKNVYVSSSTGKNVVQQAEVILEDIAQVNARFAGKRELAPCFIILPLYQEQYSWWSIRSVRRKLRKLEARGLVNLPPLTEIEYRHLAAFLPELPKPARRDFKTLFSWEDINQDFYQCLKEDEVKRYRDVIPKFTEILQQRWLNNRI